jgi:hypothetical protein
MNDIDDLKIINDEQLRSFCPATAALQASITEILSL